MVYWKRFIRESNTWKGRENLENTKEMIEEFEKEYWWDQEDIARQEHKEEIFKRRELPGRFMAKRLFE